MNHQEFRKTQPPTRDITHFDVPQIKEDKIDGTQRFYVHHTPELGVLKMMLWFPCGTANQTKSFEATAAFDLLFSGGNGKSEKEIIGYLDHLGASVSTDTDMFSSTVTIKCSTLNALDVFNWVVQAIQHAEYPEFEFENYKLVKYASLERKMQTPNYWSSRLAFENYYGKTTLLGKHGNLDDVQQLDRNKVIHYSKSNISIGNAMLLIAGECNNELRDALLNIHNLHFNTPFEYPKYLLNQVFSEVDTDILKYNLSNSTQTSIVMMKHVGDMSEDKLHIYSLLNMVLGGYFGSRLMQEIREEKGLTYGIGSYFRTAFEGRSWIISGEMNSENSSLALNCINEIMLKLQKERLSDQELDRAKRYYSGQFRSGFDGPFALAGKLQQKIQRNYSDTFYADTLNCIWNVTPEQLLQLAENELNPSTFIVTMAGKVE